MIVALAALAVWASVVCVLLILDGRQKNAHLALLRHQRDEARADAAAAAAERTRRYSAAMAKMEEERDAALALVSDVKDTNRSLRAIIAAAPVPAATAPSMRDVEYRAPRPGVLTVAQAATPS